MAHLDLANKLFVGLYYLRPPDDRDTRGGGICDSSWRGGEVRFAPVSGLL